MMSVAYLRVGVVYTALWRVKAIVLGVVVFPIV